MSGSLLVRGGRVVSPEDSLDGAFDVLISEGVIREIAPHILAPADSTVDARGLIVGPGFVDLHVHLREPGGEASETLATGLAAAVAGGFTAVCPMPNTQPVNDSAELTRSLVERAQQLGLARVFPIAAVSPGSRGETLTDFEALLAAGAVAFSDDGRPVKTAQLMRRAFETALPLGVPVIDHCEEPTLSAGGAMNEGPVAERLGYAGIPAAAEEVCVARDLVLAEAFGARLHVAHLSTARGVRMVRAARRRGVRVTCEATPHHFTLDDEAVERFGTHAKMSPPLRSARDVAAIVEGLADGTIDAIATDHAPHAPALKQKPFAEAPNGVIGLETALPLALRLVDAGRISLAHLVVLMSTNPGRILSAAPVVQARAGPLGRIQLGGPADLTVFDPRAEWTYRAAEGRSKSRNSPFDGWQLRGRVRATIVGGQVVFESAPSSAC